MDKLKMGQILTFKLNFNLKVHALDDMHIPFFNTKASQDPPRDLPWHMIKGFIKVNKGKVERFVCSDVFCLQLADNGDGIIRHKAELSLMSINVWQIWPICNII